MTIRFRKVQSAKLIVTKLYFRGREIIMIFSDNNNT